MVEWLTLCSKLPAGALFQHAQKRKSAQIKMQFVHDSTLVCKKNCFPGASSPLACPSLREFIHVSRRDSAVKGNAQCTLCSYKLSVPYSGVYVKMSIPVSEAFHLPRRGSRGWSGVTSTGKTLPKHNQEGASEERSKRYRDLQTQKATQYGSKALLPAHQFPAARGKAHSCRSRARHLIVGAGMDEHHRA